MQWKFFWRLAACLILLTARLWGQAVSGSITGYVYDASQAVVAEAKITITNTDTALSVTRLTDASGRFLVTNLPPGTYSASVEAPGFRRFVQENIVVRIDSTVR